MREIMFALVLAAFCFIMLILKTKAEKQEKQNQEDEIKAFQHKVIEWLKENDFYVSTDFSYHKPKSSQGFYVLIDEEYKRLMVVNLFDLNYTLINFNAILGMQILEDKKYAGGVGGIATGTPQVTTTSLFSDFLTKVGNVSVIIYLNDFAQPQLELDFHLSGTQFRTEENYVAIKNFMDRLMATIRVILAQNEKSK